MATKFKVQRQPKTVTGYVENLDGVPLEMILIPPGTFMMGAPETEEGSRERERPVHQVNVSYFFMGRYPVTQVQWRAIAQREDLRVGKALKPDPSRFEGDNRPVERVSWYDSLEYCARLTRLTGRNYRLPSEAEWEYACRAGTRTPFHFGETISTDVANYYGDKEYGKETTDVTLFKATNEFGLSDMHGNVWEWCLDPWHDNYNGAPNDGSVWDEENNDNRYQNLSNNIKVLLKDERNRIVRGGSWVVNPVYCRSAYRHDFNPRFDAINYLGLRVVVSDRT